MNIHAPKSFCFWEKLVARGINGFIFKAETWQKFALVSQVFPKSLILLGRPVFWFNWHLETRLQEKSNLVTWAYVNPYNYFPLDKHTVHNKCYQGHQTKLWWLNFIWGIPVWGKQHSNPDLVTKTKYQTANQILLRWETDTANHVIWLVRVHVNSPLGPHKFKITNPSSDYSWHS